MRKKYLLFVTAMGILTSCDPLKDEEVFDVTNISAEQLLNGATFEQFAATKNEDGSITYTADASGNYIKFNIPSVSSVTVFYTKPDGSETVLSKGCAGGMFNYTPKRGSAPVQTVYFRYINQNGEEVVAGKEFTLTVATALTPEVRLLASDAYGKKIWKWDTEFITDPTSPNYQGAWGNKAYTTGASGSDFVDNVGGVWFGCPPAGLVDQLKHSDTGVATGEEDPNAYMEFYDDGTLITYNANGNKIREGNFSVTGYTGERTHDALDGTTDWALGKFTTTEGSILFPFQINGGGFKPTDFELMQLDASHLKLIYATSGTGSWGEATWWAFRSVSDPEAALTNFATKDWTWDTEFITDETSSNYQGAWGNKAYTNAASGSDFANDGGGIWFGCPPAGLVDQLNHSDTGAATGEEDPNAYMTFDWETGTVTSYNAAGNQIRSGKFEIANWGMGERTQDALDGTTDWAMGTLKTDAGSILFPFQINGGGNKPTEFEILQLDSDHLKLVYAAPGTGSWGEATWWAFKKK